jgi:hypothetical protein
MSEDAPTVSRIISTENESQRKQPRMCECGCGNITNRAKQTDNKIGIKKGDYLNFLRNHYIRKKGSESKSWKGGRNIHMGGYIRIHEPTHKWAGRNGYVRETRIIIERVLGKDQPYGSVMHHFDENKSNNNHCNLVLCQDDNYHKLLHQRTRAFYASGFAHYRKCYICQKYDDPINLTMRIGGGYHNACLNKHRRELYRANQSKKCRN